MDIRKYGITVAVAILTAILIYSIADAIAPQVDYDNCYKHAPYGPDAIKAQRTNCTDAEPDAAAQTACEEQKFMYEARYSTNGCIQSYECNSCYKEQQDNQQKHNAVFFYIAIIISLIAVVAGFLLPLGNINEWVGLGFIVGGVIGMFIGTVQYWGDLARIARPFVIAAELAVVLFIVYKRMKSSAPKKKKR